MSSDTIPGRAGRRAWLAYLPWLRLLACVGVSAAVFLMFPSGESPALAALVGWDAGILALVAWLISVMAGGTPNTMRRRASRQDPGRSALLAVVVGGALVSLLALAFIQKTMKAAPPEAAAIYLGTTIATILLSWFLVHLIFTLHYAHRYYGPAADENDEDGLIGGLCFPEEKQPDYWDFMYFSFVVGMTCQVSDVEITGRGLRRLALVHGIVSFFFNTIILALTINIIASII